MLNALTRIFQASPDRDSEHDRASMENGPEDVESQRRAVSIADDSGLGLETPRLERRPSIDATAIMDARRRAPSHVSWKTPTANTNTNTNPSPSPIPGSSWNSQYDSHSASAPSLLMLGPNAAAKASSMHRQSSRSLRTPSVSGSEDYSRRNSPEKHDSAELHPARHVASLDPRMRFPSIGVRRPSTDSVPLTPDSTRAHDGHLAAYPGAFINRPINRTVSQSSISTAASVPSIPPLDLRPDFQKTIGLPIRKSRLAPPTLPPVIGSPHPGKYSVIYEDGSSMRTSRSFVTAPSVHSAHDESTPEPGGTQPGDQHSVYARDYAASNAPSDDVTPAVRTSGLPEGLYDVDLGEPLHAGPSTSAGLESVDTSPRATQPLLPAPPNAIPRRQRSAASSITSESYIHNRWLRGVSFGSGNYESHVPRTSSMRKVRSCLTGKLQVSSACCLFWLGFVGPWCWLIGGWVLTAEGELERDYIHHVAPPDLPLSVRHGKRPDAAAERRKARNLLASKLFPLVAPSVESLTPSVHTQTSVMSARRLKKGALQVVDPWVIRCRIAAIMSGVLILAAVIIALIVAASRY